MKIRGRDLMMMAMMFQKIKAVEMNQCAVESVDVVGRVGTRGNNNRRKIGNHSFSPTRRSFRGLRPQVKCNRILRLSYTIGNVELAMSIGGSIALRGPLELCPLQNHTSKILSWLSTHTGNLEIFWPTVLQERCSSGSSSGCLGNDCHQLQRLCCRRITTGVSIGLPRLDFWKQHLMYNR